MAKKIKRDSKDSATKNTLNPPNAGGPDTRDTRAPAPGATEQQSPDREVGQYTGRGTPPLQKK
jgi:hypothetical protein